MTWNIVNQKLEKEFKFKNFKDAIIFLNTVADIAEQAQHHPDLFLHGYNNLRITLFSHDEGKVTQKDRDFSKRIDQIESSDGC